MVDPPPLASGRDADVFAIDAHRVLRRYRNGGDVTTEAEVMVHVAAFGFPVPTVYEACGADLVLERLHGSTMLSALAADDLGLEDAAEVLADLHHRLHDLPRRVGTDPAARVLHLDLHPGNVVLSSRGPVVIDWRNAAEGAPDLDVALSAVILAQVAVDKTDALAASARALLSAFLRRTGGDPLSALDDAVAMRRADRGVTAEEADRLVAAAALITASAWPPLRSAGSPASTYRAIQSEGVVKFTFEAGLWMWDARRADSWTFVSLPAEASAEIRDLTGAKPRPGFGSVRVRATIGDTTWTTSIFPDAASGGYSLPIKKEVRETEALSAGNVVTVTVELVEL
jgi:tRNA A-37 threonylcarbamoyl transferase component Bud32